jgi:alpha-glucosidase
MMMMGKPAWILVSVTLALPVAAAAAATKDKSPQPTVACIASPNAALKFCIRVTVNGARYNVQRFGKPLFASAPLGLVIDKQSNAPVTRIVGTARASANTSWEQPWGEQRVIRDRHNELRVSLAGAKAVVPYDLVVRMFDDGFAFRYDFRRIAPDTPVAITNELTEFRPLGIERSWWFESRQKERDEYLYRSGSPDQVQIAETPFTIEGRGLAMSIHEAQLVDYSSMTLRRTRKGVFKADLMPWSDGVLVRRKGAFETPWRMVLVGSKPGDLADSRIELNLNAPSRIADTSWIKPTKYVGVWWEMHLEKSTWGNGPKHGANTANVERYMDFAHKYGFTGVLAEGWNTGWDGDWVANGDKFSFTQSYPDFDMRAITDYGRRLGVTLIGHNETAGALENYERQMDAGFAQYQRFGVSAVKTGYVRDNGTIRRPLPGGGYGNEWFAGQYAVRHEQAVIESAAAHRISIDSHEAVKDTGLRRTWPNWVARESARGQEYNAWGNPSNPPEHVTIIPFTRLLAGPMDYTPGIFGIAHKPEVTRRVQSTLATQLALYVVIYSPVQMAADLPENYEQHLDAFQFIRDVPADWEQSRTLQAVIGDYVVVARQARGRSDWFLGAVTDERARTLSQSLSFLTPGKRYEAQIYADAAEADFRTNPVAYVISKRVVTSKDTLPLLLKPGGGQAIRFKALD